MVICSLDCVLFFFYRVDRKENDERMGNHLDSNVNKNGWSLQRKKGDNINIVGLYIQDNAVISFAEVMVI